jgi:uncharacterized spore protein YtfJ
MEGEIQNMLDAFGDLRKRANANSCFGKPISTGERTVIPVAEVAYEFEMGIESGDVAGGKDAGGGGGMRVRPFAVVEVTPESTRVEPIVDEQKVAWAGGLLIAWAVSWLAWALVRILGPRDRRD